MRIIKRFGRFNESRQDDVIDYLLSLDDEHIKVFINNLLSHDKEDKSEYVEDILLEIQDKIDDDKYDWVAKRIKKFYII